MLEFFPALLSWFFQSFLLVLMPASCYAKFMMGLLMPPEAVQNNRGLPLSFIMASFAECPLCEGRRGERHPFSSPPPRSFFSLEREPLLPIFFPLQHEEERGLFCSFLSLLLLLYLYNKEPLHQFLKRHGQL